MSHMPPTEPSFEDDPARQPASAYSDPASSGAFTAPGQPSAPAPSAADARPGIAPPPSGPTESQGARPAGKAGSTDVGSLISESVSWALGAIVAAPVALLVPTVIYAALISVETGMMIGGFMWMMAVATDPVTGEINQAAPAGAIALMIVGFALILITGILWGTCAFRPARLLANRERPSFAQSILPAGMVVLMSLAVGVVTQLGFLLFVIPGLILTVLLMYALPAAADGHGFVGSFSTSAQLVRNNPAASIVMFLLIGLGSSLLSMTFIGAFVYPPIAALLLTAAYQRLSGRELPNPKQLTKS